MSIDKNQSGNRFFFKSKIIFSRNFFFINVNCIVSNWLIAKIILILQNFGFEAIQNGNKSECLRLKKEIVDQTFYKKKKKAHEILGKMCDVDGQECFSTKMFTNELKMDLHL